MGEMGEDSSADDGGRGASSSSSSSSMASGAEPGVCWQPQHLCTIEEVQDFLRFNRFVHKGYRKPVGYVECFRSLLYMHNESLNIYLHIFGTAFFLWRAAVDYGSGTEDGRYIAVHALALALGFVGSCMYHLFMPACCSADDYYSWLGLDLIFGIIGITGSAHSLYVYGYRCLPLWLRQLSFFVLVVLALVAIRATVTSSNVKQRMSYAGMFCGFRAIVALIFFVPRIRALGFSLAFYAHILSLVLLVLGGYLNIVRLPERKFPGRFDFGLSSHVLWHIATLVTSFLCYFGNWHDLYDYERTVC